ncbi:MAG: hypothetical protein M3Y28_07505 [Armatimonadota bacterium]|nr:hypothetical protein [Armatimonadota bacterium]
MKRSPLLETQRHLFGDGLVLAPAVGNEWELPAQYQHHGARAEYDAAHQAGRLGIIDRSWRAVLQLTGTDRQAFLQGMVSNDVAALAPGQSCRAAFLDTTGHILAELRVHARPEALLVETDPRCLPTLAKTLDKFLIMEDVEITDVSDDWVILSTVGTPLEVPDDMEGFVAGRDLWLPAESAPAAWERLVTDGATPIGEEAAEILRIEAGAPAWGHELNASVLLPEADLPDAVSYTKGCYVGQEIVARMRARGHANRALRGVLFGPDAPTPHPGSTLHAPEDGPEPGREIGRITSAVASPLFGGRPLALAYVRKEYFGNNTPLDVQIAQPDGTVFSFAGTVLTRPFVPGVL